MIVFDNVTVRFAEKTVFSDFSLNVRHGEKVVLQGRSGLGKSTLFRLLLGFERPESGTVSFDGRNIDGSSIWDVRKKIAYVCQDTDIGEGTVSDIIDQAFSFRSNCRNGYSKENLAALMERFLLDTALLDEDFSKLSGGEKQRVAIIISILLDRKVFLLDEVTAALDNGMKDAVISFFLDHADWTVLAISHDREWHDRDVRLVNLEGT